MTVLRPTAIDAAPLGRNVSGGRPGAAFLSRDTRSIEDAMGVASPNRIVHDMPRDHSVNSHQRAAGTIAIRTKLTPRHGCGPAVPFDSFADRWVCPTDCSTTEPIVDRMVPHSAGKDRG
uniref:Uncharacterized protein n=1 Tax=Agrobacterium deltaense TaxID=1183412 RepID=A0A2Z2Q3U2_9HYPH|nr:hypothetical protein [Agrobacterium deltaense]ASK49171.1 hypothetical protein [Agrobacterium deltaense]